MNWRRKRESAKKLAKEEAEGTYKGLARREGKVESMTMMSKAERKKQCICHL